MYNVYTVTVFLTIIVSRCMSFLVIGFASMIIRPFFYKKCGSATPWLNTRINRRRFTISISFSINPMVEIFYALGLLHSIKLIIRLFIRDEDPTFFFLGSGSGSAEEKKIWIRIRPQFKMKKKIYIYIIGR